MYDNTSLKHFGIKGMKWGVRRDARRDAKEYINAKMFYGKGAGTRRKLINNRVKQLSKDNKEYKEEFERAINNVNLAKSVKKAKRDRVIIDTKENLVEVGKGLFNLTTGNMVGVSTTAMGLFVFAKATGLDKKGGSLVKSFANKSISNITNSYQKFKVNAFLRKYNIK